MKPEDVPGNPWVRFENHLLNSAISKNRRSKLLMVHNQLMRTFHKNYWEASREDFEDYIGKLHRDKIRKKDGNRYSGSTKSDIKKYIKQFYKWYKGKGEIYPPEVSWVRTGISKDEKPVEKDTINITKETHLIADKFPNIAKRILVYILADSGFRKSEAYSVRKKDLKWEVYNEETDECCWWVNCSESKTQIRNVPISLFTEQITIFTNSTYFKSLRPDDFIFTFGEARFLRDLKKHSHDLDCDKEYVRDRGCILKNKCKARNITYHCFRHSSATYWADILDHLSLCDRMGWSYDSTEAKVYVRKSKRRHMKAAQISHNNELTDLRKKYDELRNIVMELLKERHPR